MGRVLLALLPVSCFGIYLFGWPAFNILILCLLTALFSEALCLRLAGRRVTLFLMDGSGLLTGLLLALCLPPWAPWWIAVSGTAFAIVVGKQVFGGIGQNPFNPAMLARVALLLSFPVQMTSWMEPAPLFSTDSPDFITALGITFAGISEQGITGFDGVTSASLLGQVKTELAQGHSLEQGLYGLYHPLSNSLGMMPGSLGETSALLIACGGLYLLYHRIISWHLPLSMLASVLLLATGFHLFDPGSYASPLYHLCSGGLMLGAFFIITDPVTSPATTRGQLLMGSGCGLLVFIIRTWGGYPEGVAFAVLLMNALTPLIDHYVRPRRYGRTPSGKPLTASNSASVDSTDASQSRRQGPPS
jgi:electron transport complex protein RnfD